MNTWTMSDTELNEKIAMVQTAQMRIEELRNQLHQEFDGRILRNLDEAIDRLEIAAFQLETRRQAA